jgi:hypothetical protein
MVASGARKRRHIYVPHNGTLGLCMAICVDAHASRRQACDGRAAQGDDAVRSYRRRSPRGALRRRRLRGDQSRIRFAVGDGCYSSAVAEQGKVGDI